MAVVAEMTMNWSGSVGGAGVSVFHLAVPADQAAAQDAIADMRTFFTNIASLVPNEISWVPGSEVRILNTNTGELTGVFSVTPGSPISGGNVGGYNLAAGGRVDWTTGIIVGGRRLRGRTYVVPLAVASYSNVGQLLAATVTQLTTAATTFRNDMAGGAHPLQVWSRANGVAADVASVSIPPMGAILRSRRD